MMFSGGFSRNKLCVDIVGPTTRSKDRPKFNIILHPLSVKPQAQKFSIMHNKSMTIANLVDIFCTTEYNHSYVLILSTSM